MNRNYIRSSLLLSVIIVLINLSNAFSATPISFKIERDAGGTYRVYMSSVTSFTGTSARIGTAQVTLRVPTGSFPNLSQGTGAPTVTGNNGMGWSANTRVNAPTENPGSDYISFGFSQSATPTLFTIPANQDILLFSFSDNGTCPGAVSLLSAGDPFKGVSTSTNPGNQISIFGNGSGNAYTANYGGPTACTALIPDLISSVGPVPPLTVGQPASLPVSVSNVGNGPAPGPVGLSTILPTGISAPATFSSTGGWGCTTTGQSVSCTTPTALSAGGSTTFAIPLIVSPGAANTTPVFSGTVSPSASETNTANNVAPPVSPAQPVQGLPDLVSSVGPVPPLTAGQTVSLPVSVSNIGSGPAAGPLGFVTTLPVSVSAPPSFMAANGWGCTTTGQSVSCTNPGSLNAGASTTFSIPITPLTAGQTPIFSGTASTPSTESNTANNGSTPVSGGVIAPAGTCVATDCGTGVRYGLRLSPDGVTYTVYMKSATAFNTTNNQSRIATAQVTISLPTGTQISSTTSLQPGSIWSSTNPIIAPSEATTRDYRSFGYSQGSPSALFNIPANAEIPLFSFTRVGVCTGELKLLDTSDPFQGVSTSTNPGNQITILGNGQANAWSCNYTCPVACPVPLLSVVKQAPAVLTQNTPFSYTITASNNGTGPTAGTLTVIDVLPAGLAFISGGGNGWTCDATGQTVSCTATTPIAAAGSSAFTLTVNPTQAGVIQNSAAISGGGSTTTTSSAPCATCPVGPTSSTVSAQLADLAISIQSLTALSAGQGNTLTVSLTNLLPGVALGPQSVTITLPAGVAAPATFTIANGGTCATSGTLVVCTIPSSVSLGQILTIPVSITPGSNLIGNSLLFTASAALAVNEVNVNNNTASVFSPAVTGSDLAVSFGTLPLLTAGQNGFIPITVSNLGQTTVPDALTLAVTLPAGLSLNAATLPASWSLLNSASGANGTTVVTLLNGNAGGLAPNGSVLLNLPVSVSAGVSGQVAIQATVTPVASESFVANNTATATLTISAPDLAVSIPTQSFTLAVGTASLLSFNVANIGSAGTSGTLALQFILPAGFSTTPTTFVTGGWSCSTTGTSVNCTNAAGLGINASSSLQIPVLPTVAAAGVTNPSFQINVLQTTGETNLANNTGTINYVGVVQGPDLAVSFPPQTFTLTAGIPTSVSVVVANVNAFPNAAGPLSLTFTLPANFSTASTTFSTSGWGCSTTGSAVSCTTAAGLSAGASVTLVVPVLPITAGQTNPSFVATVAPAPGEFNLANNTAQLTYIGSVLAGSVQIAVKMLLQGSYDVNTGLMYDKLRTQNLIPLTQPYSNGSLAPPLQLSNGTQSLTTTSAVLSVTGVNAIVDWVVVELRSAGSPATVLAATPALVQRDGDVVTAADGVSPVSFQSLTTGSYFVSVRHRNHLGAMSATALPLSATTTVVDFTQPANVYVKPGAGSSPEYVIGSKGLLWAGNTTGDAQVIFQGLDNEIDPVFFRIITDQQNTGQIANFIATGYDVTDVNMDGRTIFQGPDNEVDVIFFNVINHPDNVNLLGNFIVLQHLP